MPIFKELHNSRRGDHDSRSEGTVQPAEHHIGGGLHQHLREPLHTLPSLLWESRALQGGLGSGHAPAAAGPAAQLPAAAHCPLPALGDVPHRAAGRQPVRRRVCPPAEPVTCRGGAGESALR